MSLEVRELKDDCLAGGALWRPGAATAFCALTVPDGSVCVAR